MLPIMCILRLCITAAVNLYQQQIVELDPIIQNPNIIYGLLDDNNNTISLNIFNETYFSSSGFCFKHLKQLDVRRTSFQNENNTIPAEIQYLAPTLTDIGIYDTIITHLPYEMSKLEKLQTIKFFNTSLMIFPDFIGNFLSLNFLSLPNNMLTSLPTTIVNNSKLRQIELSNNPHLHSIQ
ncbi:unnamed protein product [Adineta steineri]|uniref:Uncharacterized protein n=1 Tax=Adineta steineri TaxID=433720 RepID=A0A820IIG9_9BILA|nr:unnamed protein product [Adineta steineri]